MGQLELLVAGVPVDGSAPRWARLLLTGLPLLCRHHLVRLNLLGVLYRGNVVGGQLLGLVQLVVADKVAALDDLGLVGKLLVPFAQALRLDDLDLCLVAPSCRIADVDLELLRACHSQVGLR